MTYEEFEKIVNSSLDNMSSYASRWKGEDSFTIENGNIVQKHVSGGAEGGNCWGDEARYFSNNSGPQKFIPLDNILKAVAPEISYLKYKEIEDLIVEGEDCDREYYGNYTDYTTFSLDIEKLYDTLFPSEG
jgi:hypothetical protein